MPVPLPGGAELGYPHSPLAQSRSAAIFARCRVLLGARLLRMRLPALASRSHPPALPLRPALRRHRLRTRWCGLGCRLVTAHVHVVRTRASTIAASSNIATTRALEFALAAHHCALPHVTQRALRRGQVKQYKLVHAPMRRAHVYRAKRPVKVHAGI